LHKFLSERLCVGAACLSCHHGEILVQTHQP
jgi:hypothetical protein